MMDTALEMTTPAQEASPDPPPHLIPMGQASPEEDLRPEDSPQVTPMRPHESPLPQIAPPPLPRPHLAAPEGYWNMHLDILSKLKNEGKDWYETDHLSQDLMVPTPEKAELEQYHGYGLSMGPQHLGIHQENNLSPSPYAPSHMAHQQHYPQEHHPYHYQNPAMGDLSPNYGHPRPAHQHHGSPHLHLQYSSSQQYPGQQHMGGIPHQEMPYGNQGMGGAMGQGMGPGVMHHHEPMREGDPYNFVDEYTGPPPRPVEEILGQQPKRRGRKPKHIKLMENGGDPVAIAAAQAAHEAKKRKWKQMGPDGKPIMIPNTAIVRPKKKIDRFEGLGEDEVAKRVLPDHLGPNLDIVIIGINPGLFAAFKGHHYAGPGNHFSSSSSTGKCLFLSGLIPEPLTADDDSQLLEHSIGFTNIVSRTTRGSTELTRKEIKEGGQILLAKLQKFQPRIAVFNGKGIYEIFSGKKEFSFGRQPEKIEGTHTHVWVMPSSSARCAQLPRALDKVPFYTALRKFRDFLKGTIASLDEEEATFNLKIRSYKSECDTTDLDSDKEGCIDRIPKGPQYLDESSEEERQRYGIETDSPKMEMDLEEEEIFRHLPQSLFNLNGMTREELESLDCPTIPIRKKRGRPKKMPEDPNAPPKPRPRPAILDPLLCNGDEIPRKKRGRPKKIVEDGALPIPKKPGRKPKALKEMLLQQQQSHQGLQQHTLQTPKPSVHQHMSVSAMNGIMSPQGYSPGNSTVPPAFSPNYGGHTPVQIKGHTPTSGHAPNHNPGSIHGSVIGHGQVPQQQQFGQSPGYSPGNASGMQQVPTPYSQPSDSTTDIQTGDEDQLGLSPAASPVISRPDFEPPTCLTEGEPVGISETQNSNLTPGHSEEQAPIPLLDQPQHTPTVGGQFSNPSTPADGSSTPYPSYPSYPSNPTHSPSIVKTIVQAGQSPKMLNRGDVSSKSLSGLESLVDQIPNLNEHETNSQHSTHSNSATCSNPTTPGPPNGPAPFSPGHAASQSSSYQGFPPGNASGPYSSSSHYSSPQSSHPYSPHYNSSSTNLSTNFSVSSLANSSLTTSLSYSTSGYELGSQGTSSNSSTSSSSFSVSSLTGGSPTPAPYSNNSYSPAPNGPQSGQPSHSSYPDIMSPPMLTPTPPMAPTYMGSPGLMGSPSPMSSPMGNSSMGPLHSSMGMSGSQLPYPYSQYGESSPGYPGSGHSFPYPSAPSFHMPSPRFPYPSPYSNSPYAQGYSQNAMLDRIKQTGMGMGFGSY